MVRIASSSLNSTVLKMRAVLFCFAVQKACLVPPAPLPALVGDVEGSYRRFGWGEYMS